MPATRKSLHGLLERDRTSPLLVHEFSTVFSAPSIFQRRGRNRLRGEVINPSQREVIKSSQREVIKPHQGEVIKPSSRFIYPPCTRCSIRMSAYIDMASTARTCFPANMYITIWHHCTLDITTKLSAAVASLPPKSEGDSSIPCACWPSLFGVVLSYRIVS